MKSVRTLPLATLPVSAIGREFGSRRTMSVTRSPFRAAALKAIDEQYSVKES